MDKVIFFDVDGPMVPARSMFVDANIVPSYGWKFDEAAVGMLNFLIWAVPNLKAVIASHRIGMLCNLTKSGECETRQDWQQIFTANGLHLPLHQDWVTVRDPEGDLPKHIEISKWLHLHKEIKEFVTLEDDLAGYDAKPTPEMRARFNLFAESFANGITHEDFKKIAHYFGITDLELAYNKYRKFKAGLTGGNEKTLRGRVRSSLHLDLNDDGGSRIIIP